VFSLKINLLKPLPDGADKRCKKEAIFTFFLIFDHQKTKNRKKIVKYRFNQVKGFPLF